MSACRDCRFFKPLKEKSAIGECVHPYSHGITRHHLDSSCSFYRSVKWRGCFVSFPKCVAIVLFYLLDLPVYFLFGKTLYKKAQGKEKPNADR